MFHRPIAAHRFFFALRPPAGLAQRIAQAADWFGDAGRAVAAERLHVTLFIPPDQRALDPVLIARLRAVGAAVAAGPVALRLDHVGSSGRVIALWPQTRNADLAALREDLAGRCRAAGVAERAGYRFSPHLTLGYRDGRPFGERIAPVAWTATEVVLIHSHLDHTRHTILDRWPLRGGSDGQLALF